MKYASLKANFFYFILRWSRCGHLHKNVSNKLSVKLRLVPLENMKFNILTKILKMIFLFPNQDIE